MSYQVLFFDLDETLYPPGNGIWEAISERMEQYMVEKLSLPVDQVNDLRKTYFTTYGTTLRGLQIHHQIDALDFLAYVHDIPLAKLIKPDPALRPLLESLPQPKWICTNADHHARPAGDGVLNIQDCFEGVVDILQAGFHPKPEAVYYQQALSQAGGIPARECVLLDDQARNLAPAQAMGFTTVLVRPNAGNNPGISRVISSLHDLPDAFPELWGVEQPSLHNYSKDKN